MQTYAATWEYLNAGFKFYVDEANKLIVFAPDTETIDIKVDLYSDLKEWFSIYRNARYPYAIRTIGGDPTSAGQTAGDIYFLINGYRVVYDVTKVQVTGVLFSDNFDTPWLQADTLNPVYPATVSSLALSVTNEVPSTTSVPIDVNAIAVAVWDSVSRTLTEAAGVTAQNITDIADAVWDEPAIEHIQAGSTGNTLNSVDNILKEVFLDTELVDAGDGTQHRPFNTLVAALDYAELNNIYNIAIHSDAILDRNLKNFAIRGIGLPEIDCNGVDLKNSEFSRVKFKGQYIDSVIVENSVLLEGSFLNGVFSNCVIDGLATCIDGSTVLVKDCASNIAGTGRPSISMNAVGTAKLSVRGWQGGLNITDCNNVLDAVTVGIDTGSLTFTNTCSAGTMVARGVGVFVDNTTGATVQNEIVFNSTIAEAVWDKSANDHNTLDTFGNRINEIALDTDELQLNQIDLTPVQSTVNEILIDTNELQLNQVDLAPVQATVDSILVDTTAILADTNELQLSGISVNLSPVTTAIAALNDFNPATDTVARVTLVDTTTTNTDMRGTDGANTVAPDNVSISAVLSDTNSLVLNQGNWVTATGFSTHTANDVVSAMQLVADDFKATLGNLTIDDLIVDTSSIVADLNAQILESIQGLGIQAPPPAYTQNYAVTADGLVITEAPNAESVLGTDTDGEMKNYTYKDVAGLHWPDANAGDDTYYAIDLTCVGLAEGETVTSVVWHLPGCITSSDDYINSDATEAHVKLATLTSGIYRIWVEINSTDLTKTSKNRVRIILKVV